MKKQTTILFLISAILMFKPIATFADNACGYYYATAPIINGYFITTSGMLAYASEFEITNALKNKYLEESERSRNEGITNDNFDPTKEIILEYYNSFTIFSNKVLRKLENCPISKNAYTDKSTFEENVAAALNEINKEEILCPVDKASKKGERHLYRSKDIAEMVASILAEKAGDDKSCI